MDSIRLILNSLRFHARSHVGAILGAAVGTAALIGALIVGDSVRGSLRHMALARIGKVDYALVGNDRFVRSELAQNLNSLGTVAAVLQVPGIVSTADNSARANQVQVLGVDGQFWKLSPGDQTKESKEGVILNRRLAEHLKARPDDSVVLRLHKPSLLSRESAISPQEDTSVVLRLKVVDIADDAAFGRFSLQANQIPPFNAYIPIGLLQKRLELAGKANLLLADVAVDSSTNPNRALHAAWQLGDAQLQLAPMTNRPGLELKSERVFLEAPVIAAGTNSGVPAKRVLTYFVNELRRGERTTPYSIVAAVEPSMVSPKLGDEEIILNQWAADDLGANVGDEVALRYFVPGNAQELIEGTNRFRVSRIVPIEGLFADRTLMPEFPGIAKAEKTENWDAGFTIDMNRIRPKDEKYWEEYRGTPKAFISLAAGQRMWSNRFGELTAIRYPEIKNPETLAAKLRTNITPAMLGLMFLDIRSEALNASAPSQDFGQLFLGLSFFLILAALILMALLYQFSIEQRIQETGTLLALGFRPKQVRNLLLLEGSGLALLGGAIGALGGIGYGWAMLRGLTTIWRNATGTSDLTFNVSLPTVLIGLFASFIICVITVILVVRKQAKQPARVLLSGDIESTLPQENRMARRSAEWICLVAIMGALALIAAAIAKRETSSAGVFFGAGALLLLAGLAASSAFLKRLAHAVQNGAPNLLELGTRNASRRRKRSLATIILLACGTFLIVSVGAFHLADTDESRNRSSGTGGFTLIGETAFPVVKGLHQSSGLEAFALDPADLPDVRFVSIRVNAGDDASCLNLNSAQKPRLLGVDPHQLASRNAFSFAKVLHQTGTNPWLSLTNLSAEEVPAIGDEASITWAMRKKVGDVIDYADERGNTFKIRIVGSVANSILQGSLLIDERAFIPRFPSEAGYRMFLIDAPSKMQKDVSTTLSRAMRDVGLELTPASERLAAFNAVQNTYLSTFQILGGLGLLLGSAGLGIVVLRNVFDRRSELAALKAVGFTHRTLRHLVLNEHLLLLLLGLVIGIFAAVVAVLPSLLTRAELPVTFLGILLGGVFVLGLLSTLIATAVSLRGELLKALRNE